MRTLARELGTNRSMVNRVWRANGLKPHLSRTFKGEQRPAVRRRKLVSCAVAAYQNPPERAMVLSSVGEKKPEDPGTAGRATQPGLPLKKGRVRDDDYADYKRNGDERSSRPCPMLDDTVISTCMDRHRHQEWIKFLKLIDPAGRRPTWTCT